MQLLHYRSLVSLQQLIAQLDQRFTNIARFDLYNQFFRACHKAIVDFTPVAPFTNMV